jgi:hypothetical protein
VKTHGIKGVRMGAPVRLQKAVPRSKENAAVGRREARRHALWAGNPVRSGMGLAVRQTNGRGVPRLRISALRYPLLEGRRVRNRQLGRKPAGMRRAATLPHATTHVRRVEVQSRTSARAGDARLLRFARNDVDGVLGRQPPSLRGARSATKQSQPPGRAASFGGTNPRGIVINGRLEKLKPGNSRAPLRPAVDLPSNSRPLRIKAKMRRRKWVPGL